MSISGRKFCRMLEREGWTLDRIRGSHHYYKKPGKEMIAVPVHGDKSMRKGTLHALAKQAGIKLR